MKPTKKITKQDLKSNEFHNLTSNTISFTLENKNYLLIAGSVLVVIFLGALTGWYLKKGYDRRATETLSRGLVLYSPADQTTGQPADPEKVKEASELFHKAYSDYSRASIAPQAMFYYGISLLHQGKNEEALAIFTEFPKRFPEHALLSDVQGLQVTTEMSLSNFQKALDILETLAQKQKGTNELSLTLLRQGICYFHLERWDDSRKSFQRILDEFETTPWSAEARDYLLLLPGDEPKEEAALVSESETAVDTAPEAVVPAEVETTGNDVQQLPVDESTGEVQP